MEISVCKGVLVRSQDDCTTQLCIKVDRDLGGTLMERGGGVLSSSTLFVSTATKGAASAGSASTTKAGAKRGRNGSSAKLPDGEKFTIPVDVTAFATAPSSSESSSNSHHQHIDMSLTTTSSDFSRISLLKEALSTILDPTTRKKLTVNAITGMHANASSINNNNKKKQVEENDDVESSSTPLSSLDFSSAVESDVDEDDDASE